MLKQIGILVQGPGPWKGLRGQGPLTSLTGSGSGKCRLKGSGGRAHRKGNVEEADPRKSRQDVWDTFRGCEKHSLAGEKGDWGDEDRTEAGVDQRRASSSPARGPCLRSSK